MSERGIEIHNGYLEFPEGSPPELHMGTETTPLTQGEEDQIIVSAVVNALALGGSVEAGVFIVIASASLTGILYGLRAEVTVNDGFTVTPTAGAHHPAVYGAMIKVEVLGAGVIGGRTEGLRIEMSSALGSETQSAFNGIFISNYNLGTQSADNYYMLRMQENGTYKIYTMFYLRPGSEGIDYFGILYGSHDAWRAFGTVSTASGFIKVNVAGVDKFIQLYNTED